MKYHELLDQVSDENGKLLKQAINAGVLHINKKAKTEELHGGSGRDTWMIFSIQEQKMELIELFSRVVKFEPVGIQGNLNEVQTSLDFVLKQISSQLSAKPITGQSRLNLTDVLTVQKTWEDFAEKSALFMFGVDKSLTKDSWKAFLSSQRLSHLEELMKKFLVNFIFFYLYKLR